MDLDDSLLPAAPYLTGPHGSDVLAPAVTAAGGVLHVATPRQVVYRPGRDLTVTFAASVSWAGRPATNETLVAGAVRSGDIPGTVPVEADGVRVSVWRYPFDPFLPGLAEAVTDTGVAALLGVPRESLRLKVVSFRACRRAVVRVERSGREDLYLKVIPPDDLDALVGRHTALRAGGLPVPEILDVFPTAGIVVSRALPGRDVRDVLFNGTTQLPDAAQFMAVVEQFASVDLPTADPVQPLLVAAPRHAAMLRRVLPEATDRLRPLLDQLAADTYKTPPRTIHGDLHDAQLRVDEHGEIIGVLDVDGAGPGDPLDDLARLTAHLHAAAVLGNGADAAPSEHAVAYAKGTLDSLRTFDIDRAAFDRRVAAALIGLATGPYRSQAAGWQERTYRVLAVAERVLEDERDLSSGS